ncbi:MAG: hypothetical protein Ct9H90mP2_13550 [Dehalococcoidia bacterium]|nr:MAG: hypothetical protein Ct9H90mP2_13550 [Dehalococcoidia bacterium]
MPVLLLMVSIIVFILGVYGPGDPIEVQLGIIMTKLMLNV